MVIPSTIKVIYSSQNGQMRVQSMNQRNIILLIAIVALSAVAIGFFTMPSQKPQATEPNVTPTPSPSPSPTPTPSPSPSPTPKPITVTADALHASLWLNTTKRALSDRLYAYAIYASRTIAVNHPEVYLIGDSIFIGLIESKGGYDKAYQTKDVTDDYFLSSTAVGPAFTLDNVDFTSYRVVSPTQLYPSGYPLLGFLDRRMQTVACTLKTTNGELTQLELAEQYYFKLNETLTDGSRVFIIYCANDESYIYNSGQLTSMNGLKSVSSVNGDPTLIFDWRGVWYPLMGRDDTAKDQTLKNVVDRFSTNKTQPELSEAEKQVLDYLRDATKLTSDAEFTLAELCAVHTEATSGARVYNEYMPYWNRAQIPLISGYGLFRAVYRVANYLSPITAYLATTSNNLSGVTRLTKISEEYTKNTATFFYATANTSWGHSWPCMLCGNTVDETYRSRGSHCVWQADNLAAVLDVMGIESYFMELGISVNGEIVGSEWHNSIYVPKYDVVIGNGVIETIVYGHSNSVVSYVDNDTPRTIIRYISYAGKWVDPIIMGSGASAYYGTMSPSEVSDALSLLSRVHGETFQGLAIESNKWHAVSFEDLVSSLKSLESSFHPVKLP
jgi:hypothetical protein